MGPAVEELGDIVETEDRSRCSLCNRPRSERVELPCCPATASKSG